MTVLLWLAAAAANSGAATQVAQAIPPQADGDRIVCKSERFVGSHRSQRICKSKSEWETGKKNAQEALRRMRLVNPPEKGGN